MTVKVFLQESGTLLVAYHSVEKVTDSEVLDVHNTTKRCATIYSYKENDETTIAPVTVDLSKFTLIIE